MPPSSGALNRTDEAVAEIRGLMKGEKTANYCHDCPDVRKGQAVQRGRAGAERRGGSVQDYRRKRRCRFARGAMFERMKNYDAAEASFRKVIEAQPDNAGALNYPRLYARRSQCQIG